MAKLGDFSVGDLVRVKGLEPERFKKLQLVTGSDKPIEMIDVLTQDPDYWEKHPHKGKVTEVDTLNQKIYVDPIMERIEGISWPVSWTMPEPNKFQGKIWFDPWDLEIIKKA